MKIYELQKFNLQLFGEEKTEQATSKKKRDARKKGQVPISKDVSSAFSLLFVFVTIDFLAGYFAEILYSLMYLMIDTMENSSTLYEVENLRIFFIKNIILGLKVVGPLLAVALITGVSFAYLQVGVLFTLEPLQPKLSKINPLEGFKKMFSIKSLVELVKSLLKSSILLIYTVSYLKGKMHLIINSLQYDLITFIINLWDVIYNIVVRISIMLIILALFDYLYKLWQHNKDLRMTKKEIKDEYKESEGDPLLKSKIRQKQRELSASRMMQEVPDADVIITNPTHFANAIKYDSSEDSVPKVVAKGKNLIAENIKRIGKEHGIHIIENKPLARAIYADVDIGDNIPEDLYHAVAEVLAYVYELDKK